MSTPDQRPRDQDRKDAVAVVEAAFGNGRIIGPDRDMRVAQIRDAQTRTELDMIVHGLPPVAAPVVAVDHSPTYAARPKAPRALLLVPIVVVLVVTIAIASAVVALVSGSSQTRSAAPVPVEPAADVLSAPGYGDLTAAVEAETGRTDSFSAVLYPTYAVVELPADATSQREGSFYWDGRTLTDQDNRSTSREERFDLQAVDPAVVVRLVKRVRRIADQPTSWYVVIHAPDSNRAMISAYASNEYDESVSLVARRDGTITYDSTEH